MYSTGGKRKRVNIYRPRAGLYRKRRRTGTARRGRRRFIPGKSRTSGFYQKFAPHGSEYKFKDTNVNDPLIAGAGTILASVNLIAQGTGEDQRIGRKCVVKSIHWMYRVFLIETAGTANFIDSTELRLIMFLDKQCNGTAATISQILETASVHSFRNLANSQRFQILYDKHHALGAVSGAADAAGSIHSASVIRLGKFNKRCSIPLEFSDITGAITEIRSNNIGILLIPSNDNIVGLESKIRLRYSDS